jgi:2-isopropylmalate synthase
MEARGYQYEGADASLEMLVRRTLPAYQAPFYIDDFWVVLRRADNRDDPYSHKEMKAEAMVKVRLPGRLDDDDQVIQTA